MDLFQPFWYPPFIFSFQVLPSITAIDDIYGQMLRGRFTKSEFDNSTLAVVDGLTRATIELWRKVKSKLLPTPAKFHYVFNLRDLSRIFAGVLMTPKNTIINGGTMKAGQDGSQTLLGLWRHECERVFCDKLTNIRDKNWYTEFMKRHLVRTKPSHQWRVEEGSPSSSMTSPIY